MLGQMMVPSSMVAAFEACIPACSYELSYELSPDGEALLSQFVDLLFQRTGCSEERRSTEDYCALNGNVRIADVACGQTKGYTRKHWHRSGVLMLNLGQGTKTWRVSDVASPSVVYEATMAAPRTGEHFASCAVLYLPPHWYHEVSSEPSSLAVHTYVVPPTMRAECAVWATAKGALEGEDARVHTSEHLEAVQRWFGECRAS